jgi:hypothetical protein
MIDYLRIEVDPHLSCLFTGSPWAALPKYCTILQDEVDIIIPPRFHLVPACVERIDLAIIQRFRDQPVTHAASRHFKDLPYNLGAVFIDLDWFANSSLQPTWEFPSQGHSGLRLCLLLLPRSGDTFAEFAAVFVRTVCLHCLQDKAAEIAFCVCREDSVLLGDVKIDASTGNPASQIKRCPVAIAGPFAPRPRRVRDTSPCPQRSEIVRAFPSRGVIPLNAEYPSSMSVSTNSSPFLWQ